MLKIGEFSKLSRVSVRMLRHYDEIGLLKPAEIDRFTDYRYYREDQLPIAGRIAALKDMGFSLADIVRILEVYDDREKLEQFFSVRQEELEALSKDTAYKLTLLDAARKRLRKARLMTQEELAEALYVSRTAISKWESGRGYPSIDSLKEISRFFSVTIDDLICPDEMITVAENDKREFVSKYVSLICCVLDALLAILVFIPAFGNGTDSSGAVSLFGLTGISPWVKTLFIVIISIAILNGISGVIIVAFSKPVWNRHRLITGVVLSILAVLVFIATRQPYAGIVCFAFLVIKGFLIAKTK